MVNEDIVVVRKTAHARLLDGQGRIVRDAEAEADGWQPGTPHPSREQHAPPEVVALQPGFGHLAGGGTDG